MIAAILVKGVFPIIQLFSTLPVAVRYMLLSALGFSLMGVCVKAVSTYGIPVLEIVAARAIVSLLLSYADVKRKRLSVWGNNKRLLFARGATGAFALMCLFYAFTTLPLAKATLLQFTFPAFTAILALFLLKERVQLSTIACIGLSLLGLLVLVKPDLAALEANTLPELGVLAGLAGAVGSAFAYVIVRHLSQTEDSSVIIFYFPLVALPISALWLGDSFVMPTWEALVLLVLVGVFTQVGQVGLTKAMAAEKAGKVSAYAYVQVIFAAVLGFVFFAEIPTVWSLAGGGLIMTGALINALWKR